MSAQHSSTFKLETVAMTVFHDEQDARTSRPVWRKWRWAVAGSIGLFVIVLGLANLLGRSAVATRLAEIRARGEPTSYDELEAYYVAPPPGEDATRTARYHISETPTGFQNQVNGKKTWRSRVPSCRPTLRHCKSYTQLLSLVVGLVIL
jgi:hypothetical protein